MRRAAPRRGAGFGAHANLFGLCALGLAFLLPLYVVVATALKPLDEITGGAMLALPVRWTFAPLATAWSSACIGATCDGLARGFWNSAVIVVPATILAVMFGAVNGYALTKWRLPGADLLFGLMLAANVIPYQAVLLPMAVLMRGTGLFGTTAGLIVIHVVYGMPYMTLLFRNYYMTMPSDIVGAARLDGASFWSSFRYVALPAAAPMLAVATLLQFTGIWNDYLFGLVFGGRAVPVTVMLNNLVNSQSGQPAYNVNMAGVLLTAIPPLLCYMFAGRLLLRGLGFGLSDR